MLRRYERIYGRTYERNTNSESDTESESEEKNMPGEARRKAEKKAMTDYSHKWEIKGEQGHGEYFECQGCGVHEFPLPDGQMGPLFKQPCPERIVQEVVSRLSAELKKADIIPAKRKDRNL